VLYKGGGWPELRIAAIPTRGGLRLPPAVKTCRPPSSNGVELSRYATNPNHTKKKNFSKRIIYLNYITKNIIFTFMK
jgi:hypothetical protein